MTFKADINPYIIEVINDEVQKLNLEVININQRYEDIDDLVTVVCLSPDAAQESLLKLEEAVSCLESQVIVVKKSY